MYLPNVTIETIQQEDRAELEELQDTAERDLEEEHNLDVNAI